MAKEYLAHWEAGVSWHGTTHVPLLHRLILTSTNCCSVQQPPSIYTPARERSGKLPILLSLGCPCSRLLLRTLCALRALLE